MKIKKGLLPRHNKALFLALVVFFCGILFVGRISRQELFAPRFQGKTVGQYLTEWTRDADPIQAAQRGVRTNVVQGFGTNALKTLVEEGREPAWLGAYEEYSDKMPSSISEMAGRKRSRVFLAQDWIMTWGETNPSQVEDLLKKNRDERFVSEVFGYLKLSVESASGKELLSYLENSRAIGVSNRAVKYLKSESSKKAG